MSNKKICNVVVEHTGGTFRAPFDIDVIYARDRDGKMLVTYLRPPSTSDQERDYQVFVAGDGDIVDTHNSTLVGTIVRDGSAYQVFFTWARHH